jgi:DNA-binding response OmpR family regulator
MLAIRRPDASVDVAPSCASGSARRLPMTSPMTSASDTRVLLAEDDKDVRDLLCDALRIDEFTVMPVADGTQAIRTFRDHEFDVVLTDLALPGHNGLEVAQACRRQRPTIKVIMLTAWDAHIDDVDVDHGIDLLLPKTLGITVILDALHELRNPVRYRRVSRTMA